MLQRRFFQTTSIYLLLLISFAYSQATFKVVLIDGTAKYQKSTKKSWDNVYLGDQINDNDMVESFFQTRIMFNYGIENSIILGSNTRILLNIKESDDKKNKRYDVNITIFSGGILVKAVAQTHVNIYSSNGVAQIDSGTISSIVEAKSGHTGFQMLGGMSMVRNIAQQENKKLSVGLTTIILPGKEPTAPLYMTYRHVEVLKQFFGDAFIKNEIEQAGIEPTEDIGSGNRLIMDQKLYGGKPGTESQAYPLVFSYDKIFGSIMVDERSRRKSFVPVGKTDTTFSKNKLWVLTQLSIGHAGGVAYPQYTILPVYYNTNSSFGFRLSLDRDNSNGLSMHLNSLAGVLDKIERIDYQVSEKMQLHLGSINDLTLGNGLVVDRFFNKSAYSVVNPLGLEFGYQALSWKTQGFIADMANPTIGGIYTGYYPGPIMLEAGYYFDGDQYKTHIDNITSRFLRFDTLFSIRNKVPDQKRFSSGVQIYEANLGYTQYVGQIIVARFMVQFAQKMFAGNASGFVFRAPELSLEYENMKGGFNYYLERGKLLTGYFDPQYMSNRCRYSVSPLFDTLYSMTMDNLLSNDRKVYGVGFNFKMSPKKGVVVEFNLKQDFVTFYPYNAFNGSLIRTDSLNANHNFNYALYLQANKDLFSPIDYACLTIMQTQGGYFPILSNYFSSWGFIARLDVVTRPLLLKTAFQAGLSFSYLDQYDQNKHFGALNNRIDSGDILFEWYIGLQRGFL